jgi:hypothetical protein
MELWLDNRSDATLRDLRVQICVMLARLTEFAQAPFADHLLRQPFAACRNAVGDRWLITVWEGCQRAWGNAACPCIHSDPQFPDCAPGERHRLRGWLSFYSGSDIEAELRRLERSLPWLASGPRPRGSRP